MRDVAHGVAVKVVSMWVENCNVKGNEIWLSPPHPLVQPVDRVQRQGTPRPCCFLQEQGKGEDKGQTHRQYDGTRFPPIWSLFPLPRGAGRLRQPEGTGSRNM